MNRKINCWEFRNCGLEPGGLFSKIHGECPVPRMMKFDGINNGIGAGRTCWAVNCPLPESSPQVCRRRRIACSECDFYQRVCSEHDPAPAQQIAEETSPGGKMPVL